MNEARLETIEQIQEFLGGTADIAFSIPTDESTLRAFVATVLRRFDYFCLAKGHRGVLFSYMRRLTGYSRQHLSRLIGQYRHTQSLKPLARVSPTSFARKYGPADVALLAETDRLHDPLSGPATRVLLRRACATFGDQRFARLAEISVSHLYNLRASEPYRKQRLRWMRTRPHPWPLAFAKHPPRRAYPAISVSIPCTRAIRTA